MVVGLVRGDWLFVGLLAAWWWLSRSIKLLPHLRRRPSSIFVVPPFVLLSFAMAVLKLYALATVRTQRWLTRDVEVVGDEVVRTNEDDAAAGLPLPVQPAEVGAVGEVDVRGSLFVPPTRADATVLETPREQRA